MPCYVTSKSGGAAAVGLIALTLAALGGCAGWMEETPPPGVFSPGVAQHSPAARRASSWVAPQRREVLLASYADTPEEAPLADATPADALTLDEVFEHTIDHHPLLRARRHEIEAARGTLVTASLFPNPQLVLDTDAPVHGGNVDLGGRVDFTFQLGHKRERGMAVACAAIRRAQFALDREMLSVLTETSDAALEVLYLQELAELQAEVSNFGQQVARLERDKAAAGLTTVPQGLLAEVAATNLEVDRLGAQSKLELARMRLAKAIGLNPPRPIGVSGKLEVKLVPPLSLATVLAAARDARPEIGEAESTLAESRRAHELALAESIPDLQIGPRWNDRIGVPNGDSVGGRVSFDLPVFDRNEGNIAQTAATVSASQALRESIEIATLGDVAATFQQLQPLEVSMRHYESTVAPLIERTERTLRSSKQTEVLDAGEVSDGLRRVGQMRIGYLNSRYLHARLRAQLELFLGRDLEELSPGAPHPAATETIEPPEAVPAPAPERSQRGPASSRLKPKPVRPAAHQAPAAADEAAAPKTPAAGSPASRTGSAPAARRPAAAKGDDAGQAPAAEPSAQSQSAAAAE